MRDGWTETTFGDVFKIVAGKYVAKEEYVEGGEFWIYGSNSIMGKLDRFLVEQSHVVMAAIGAYAGAVRYSKEPSWINNNAMALVPSDKIMAKYLHLWLETEFDLKRVVVGTGQPYVQRPLLLKEIIELPPLPEQKRIVDLISSVDSYIEALQLQLVSAKKSRNAVLHELLTAGGDDWLETTLGEVSEVIGGGTPSTSVPEYWEGEIVWLTPTEITSQDGEFVSNSNRKISELGLKNSGAQMLPKGSVILTSRASVGFVAISAIELCTNQGFQSLVPNDSVLAEFLMFWIQQNRSEFESRSAGSTFKEISKSNVKSIKLSLPPLSEQRRVVEIISTIDEVKGKTEIAINEAKRLRSGLLSDLLSGEHEIPASYDKVIGAA
jgi:type I restriction enzyme S subunit